MDERLVGFPFNAMGIHHKTLRSKLLEVRRHRKAIEQEYQYISISPYGDNNGMDKYNAWIPFRYLGHSTQYCTIAK